MQADKFASSLAWRHIPMWTACTAASILAAACIVLFSQSTLAQSTITVTTTADELEPNGDCSLREAIESANHDIHVDACAAGSGADTIMLPAGIYTITLAGPGENNNQTGDFDVTGSVQIVGAGVGNSIIAGARADRIFHINAGAVVSLTDVQVTGGLTSPTEPGGAILNAGNLTIDRFAIEDSRTGDEWTCTSGCTTSGAPGGGIANQGTLTMTATVVRGNSTGLNVLVYRSELVHIFQHAPGGGIYNTGTLRIVGCEIAANQAGEGAGIYNFGQTVIVSTTVSNNSTTLEVRNGFPYGKGDSSGAGAGIANAGGTLELYSSAVFDNVTADGGWGNRGPGGDAGQGGGILNNGTLQAANSTVAQNRTGNGGVSVGVLEGGRIGGNGGDGGGFYNTGIAVLNNVTIAANTVGRSGDGTDGNGIDGAGGGLYNGGELRLRNTIVGDNDTASGIADCAGDRVTSLGFNLIASSECNGVNTSSDHLGIAPHLGPLADFGGQTYTVALMKSSPAINASSCLNSDAQPVAEDQRGVARPQGSDCDIGAHEFTADDPLFYLYLPIAAGAEPQ